MTEPTRISTAELNRWVYEHAEDAGVRNAKGGAKMSDPSLEQTKQQQRFTAKDGVKSLALNGAAELVTLTGGVVAFATAAATPAMTAIQMITVQLEANEHGEQLSRAAARDAMYLAVLNLASGSLPKGFVERSAHTLRTSQRGAELILTKMHTSPDMASYKSEFNAHATRGREAASKLGVVDAASLAQARKNPAFDADYRNNPAFHFGVQAEMYLAKQAQP